MTGLTPFSLPLARPLGTASGAIDRRDGFLVHVGDDPDGLGEATPLPGWTESLGACRAALESAVDDGPLGDPADLPAMASTPAARHGLELALLDREARVAGRPLYRHLGADGRVGSVPVNAAVGDGTAEETVEACRAAADGGFGAVKLKVGARSVEEDVARVARARDAVGAGIELRVDANGAWSAERADRAVERLAGLGVSMVEQPLAAPDLDGHAALRGRGVDVAVDESVCEHGAAAVLDAGAADVLVLKPMALGGIGPAHRAAERAAAADVGVVVTTTVDAAVARTAAVHLAAAVAPRRACGLATAEWLERDVADDPADEVDGAVSVPQAAGHGVSVGARR